MFIAGALPPQGGVAGGRAGSGVHLRRSRSTLRFRPAGRNGAPFMRPASLTRRFSLSNFLRAYDGAQDFLSSLKLTKITNQFVGYGANGDPDISTAFVSIAVLHGSDHEGKTCKKICLRDRRFSP